MEIEKYGISIRRLTDYCNNIIVELIIRTIQMNHLNFIKFRTYISSKTNKFSKLEKNVS